ncbi:hypothetical protein FJMB80067_08670 [Enterobacter hormaechei]|nr:hypothetical protein FJMB80005_08640 [Enterobacter hormaechei]BDJ30877.1 hypothetical protein FJMB80017_08690 [Enterobacter hormaechei]BDJ89664.1 hypothetical protein FJMB80067_08670 [Enterobacter hormaechei]
MFIVETPDAIPAKNTERSIYLFSYFSLDTKITSIKYTGTRYLIVQIFLGRLLPTYAANISTIEEIISISVNDKHLNLNALLAAK